MLQISVPVSQCLFNVSDVTHRCLSVSGMLWSFCIIMFCFFFLINLQMTRKRVSLSVRLEKVLICPEYIWYLCHSQKPGRITHIIFKEYFQKHFSLMSKPPQFSTSRLSNFVPLCLFRPEWDFQRWLWGCCLVQGEANVCRGSSVSRLPWTSSPQVAERS